MLMNENGQVKLCDMGLAKTVIGKTYTMCGTPEYMSPEVRSKDAKSGRRAARVDLA